MKTHELDLVLEEVQIDNPIPGIDKRTQSDIIESFLAKITRHVPWYVKRWILSKLIKSFNELKSEGKL